MTDKQIIIDGVEYNPCNGCKLWNGHHCIGARSYEPNADEHKAICNEHMAKQFYIVYQQLYRKTQECESLKEEIEVLKDNFDTATRDCNELIEELKQECEELKERIKCNCFDPKSNNNRCISYNRIAEDYERDLKRLENKIAECEKYKQTLDEFELLITNHISSCEKCPDNKNGYCIGIDECSSRCLKKILDIINKAKEEI